MRNKWSKPWKKQECRVQQHLCPASARRQAAPKRSLMRGSWEPSFTRGALLDWLEYLTLGGGGAWIDEGSHAVDLLRWLNGDITRIALMATNRNKPQLKVE